MNQPAKSSDKTENDEVNMQGAEQFWFNPNSTPSTPPIPLCFLYQQYLGGKITHLTSREMILTNWLVWNAMTGTRVGREKRGSVIRIPTKANSANGSRLRTTILPPSVTLATLILCTKRSCSHKYTFPFPRSHPNHRVFRHFDFFHLLFPFFSSPT